MGDILERLDVPAMLEHRWYGLAALALILGVFILRKVWKRED